MGLTHPADLAAWQRWQDSRRPLRAARRRARSILGAPSTGVLHVRGDAPELVVVLDSLAPSSVAALVAPLRTLSGRSIAVLAPGSATDLLPHGGWSRHAWRGEPLPPSCRLVVSTGHFLPLGAHGWREASRLDVPYVVVQHGVLTPAAPPLAPTAHLLAWSAADAAYWSAGRRDVSTEVVGAQVLWRPHADPVAVRDPRPIFLGQLHGAELPRRVLARAAEDFCRRTGASYRPHPAEVDRASRARHRRWSATGIEIERDRPPLADLGRPVASVFSTGVLEAAALGLPTGVSCPDPPPWLLDFWARYAMPRWDSIGERAEARPAEPDGPPPADRVASAVGRIIDHGRS